MPAKENGKPVKPEAKKDVPPWIGIPSQKTVGNSPPDIPSAVPGEDVDALVRKIAALQSLSSRPGSSSDKVSPVGGDIPPISHPELRTEPVVRSAAETAPPSSGAGSIPSSLSSSHPPPSSLSNAEASIQVSNMVRELQSISKEQSSSDTFEARIADKPKTLIEEYKGTKIYRVQGEPLLYYWIPVARPTVNERSIINTLKEATTRLISLTPYRIKDPEQKRYVYSQQVVDILRASPELKVPPSRFDFYAQAVVTEMVGYGLIDSLIKDDNLEEVMVIGPNVPVYVFHRKYDMMMTNVEFNSDVEVQDLINRIAREVGRRVDISSPLLDARLPDGSRVNATIPPASVSGSTLTIRKFRTNPYSVVDLIKHKAISVEVAAFLWVCVEGLGTHPANLLISGGTSSGKTTLLNVLCSFIPANERIISIEDTSELNLPLRHWIRLEGRPPGLEGKGEITLDILTKNSLRMRPDRIIVGEVRHDEAFSLFTAMNTGHDGSMGTIHANSAQETLVRVISPPMNVPEAMLSGLNFVIVANLFHSASKGSYRRVTEISEVTNVLEGHALTQTIFVWDPVKDELQRTNAPVHFLERLAALSGKKVSEMELEFKRRERFLQGLVDRDVHDLKTVCALAQEFLGGP